MMLAYERGVGQATKVIYSYRYGSRAHSVNGRAAIHPKLLENEL